MTIGSDHAIGTDNYGAQIIPVIAANLVLLMADVGDASAATLGSIYGILGNPPISVLAMLSVPTKNSVNDVYMRDVVGKKDDDAIVVVDTDTSLMGYTKGILNTVLAIGSAQTEVSVYAPQFVDVNNVGHIEVCMVDKDVGLIPAANIVAGTYQLVRIRAAASTNIGAVAAWSKLNGRIYADITFAAADWSTDDAFQIVPQGDTTYAVGLITYYPAVPTIQGYIGDLSAIEGKIDTIDTNVDAINTNLGQNDIPAALYCLAAGSAVFGDWAALTNTGKFSVTIDGVICTDVTPDFTGDGSMAEVATSIQTALQLLVAGTTCVWSVNHLNISSNKVGNISEVSALRSPSAGIDLAGGSWINGIQGRSSVSALLRDSNNTLNHIEQMLGNEVAGDDSITEMIGSNGIDDLATQIGANGLDSIAAQLGCDSAQAVNLQLGYGASGSVWQDLTDIKAELEVGSVVSGAAAAGSSDSLIVCPTLTQATGYFNSWCVLVTSGVRAGQIREVAGWDLPTTTITLYNPLTGAIGVADTFVIMSPNFMANVNIGVNNNNNRADTSLVVANADGSVLERDQYNQEAIAAAAGDLTNLMADVGDASASTLGSILAIAGNPGTKSISDQIGADSTDSIVTQIGADGADSISAQVGADGQDSIATQIGADGQDSIATQIGCDGVQAVNLQLGYGAAGSVSAALGSPLKAAAASTLSLILGDPGATDISAMLAAIAPLGSLSGDSSGSKNLADDALEQDVVVLVTAVRKRVEGIWLDMVNIAGDGTVRIYYKIDGGTYREVDSIPFAVATDSDGFYVPVNMGITNDFKVTYQATLAEGSVKAIPYSIIYSNLE